MLPLIVLGGLAAAAWWWNRKTSGHTAGILNVVRRAALLKGASLAVVEVGGRHFLVGATEHRVELLTELDNELFAGMDAGTSSEPWTDLFERAKSLVRRDDPTHGFDDSST